MECLVRYSSYKRTVLRAFQLNVISNIQCQVTLQEMFYVLADVSRQALSAPVRIIAQVCLRLCVLAKLQGYVAQDT